MSPTLTIAITTYNRNEMLLRTVRSVLNQAPADVKVLILDNHSDHPVAETLAELTRSYPETPFTVHRHSSNIGAGANMLRSFELCDTDWLWLLTDKAFVKPGCVAHLLETIRENSDCLFINFDVELSPPSTAIPRRTTSVVTTGREDLINNILYFGSIIDQMASVYYVPRIRTVLHVGYSYIHCSAAQLVIVLAALRDSDRCFLSSEQIVMRPGTPPGSQWSTLYLMQGCMSILNLPLTPSERRRLEQKVLEFLPSRRHYLAKMLILAANKNASATYYYRTYVNLLRFHDHRLGTRVLLLVASLLMIAPSLSLRVLEAIAQRRYGRSLYEAAEPS